MAMTPFRYTKARTDPVRHMIATALYEINKDCTHQRDIQRGDMQVLRQRASISGFPVIGTEWVKGSLIKIFRHLTDTYHERAIDYTARSCQRAAGLSRLLGGCVEETGYPGVYGMNLGPLTDDQLSEEGIVVQAALAQLLSSFYAVEGFCHVPEEIPAQHLNFIYIENGLLAQAPLLALNYFYRRSSTAEKNDFAAQRIEVRHFLSAEMVFALRQMSHQVIEPQSAILPVPDMGKDVIINCAEIAHGLAGINHYPVTITVRDITERPV